MYLSGVRIRGGQSWGRVMARTGSKSQFNIRIDRDLLGRFREYCQRHGLDPHGQIVIFMKRMVEAEYDFQDKLWDALRAEAD